MALYIYTTAGNGKTASEIEWHIFSPRPMKLAEIHTITDIEANGHELEYILERFENIKRVKVQSSVHIVAWYGDDAKFIIGNLV